MALFTCPECGKKISDTAGFCPNCGYPVRNTETTTVRIRIPEELHGQYKGRKNYAEVSCNQKVVWSGILGTTAVFSLAQKAEVNVYMDDGVENGNASGWVEPGHCYCVRYVRNKGILRMRVYGLFEE